MKNYKEFEQIYIGGSDIASLVLVGCKTTENGEALGAFAELLHFGEDGEYHAYYSNEPCIIGEHYKKVTSFDSWLKIYDDTDRTFYEYGSFNIYRSGDFGCIIEKVR